MISVYCNNNAIIALLLLLSDDKYEKSAFLSLFTKYLFTA